MPYKDPAVKKAKHAEYSAKYYENNKDKQVQANSRHRKKKRIEWSTFKSTLKCVNCGFSHPAAIDFHHVAYNKNNRKVNKLAQNGNYKAAMDEIKRCVPLCANCHRIHHHEERSAAKNKRKAKKKNNSSP